jgi:translocation and assembly module TamB
LKRAVVWTLGVLLLLILLPLGIAGWILGSESGTRTLLRQLDSFAPGLVTIGHSEGDLLGQLELEQLKVDWGTGLLEIDQLLLSWSPGALFDRRLQLNELAAKGLRYVGKPAEQVPAEPLQWPIELPNLKLPITLDIRKLSITNANFIAAPEAVPVQLDNAELVALWDGAGIAIDRFQLDGPHYKALISGQLNPNGDYVLNLDNQLQLALEDDTRFDLKGSILGNRHSLQIEQVLGGAASAGLSLNLRRPLVEPAWSGRVNLVELPVSLLGTALPIVIGGSLVSSGTWPIAQLTGELKTSSTMQEYDQLQLQLEGDADVEQISFQISKLELSQHQRPLHVSVKGKMAADKSLDVAANWRDLQWPLLGNPALSSSTGKLSVTGLLSNYQFNASAQLAAPAIPLGHWQLAGTGDQQHMTLAMLQGQILQGDVKANGELAWAPFPSWTLSASGEGLQTSSLVAELDTALSFQATTKGSIEESEPSVQVVLKNLSGTLNDRPVAGSGEFDHTSERTDIRRLQITVGGAAVNANGMLGPKESNLRWELQVPALQQLLPDASGQLSLNGNLDGPLQAPGIRAKLVANKLSYQQLDLSQLSANINLDLQDKRRSSAQVEGTDLVMAGQSISQLQLDFDGFIREHNIRLSVSQPESAQTAGNLALAAQGAYAKNQWSGTLQRLSLQAAPLGEWRLQQPFGLTAGATAASAEPFCLRQLGGASLCAEGYWQAQGTTAAQFNLSGLPLAQFSEYFPASISRLEGELSVEGNLQRKQNINARLKAKVSPGQLVIQDISGKDQLLDHNGAELEFITEGVGVAGWLRSRVGTTTLNASAKLVDLLQVTDKQQARLEGNLQIAAPDLQLVPLLVPAVSAIQGTASANFQVTGRLGEPLLLGGSSVDISRLDIEQIGWELDDALLEIKADGNTLLLDGSVVSKGRLAVSGELGLSAEQGWPLSVAVIGSDFAVTDLPNMQVYVSPDLKVQHGADGLSLTGTITIPKAQIIIRDLPAGALSPSSDVVVLREDGSVLKIESTAPISTDIDVRLGDKVQVSALGFDGYIGGQLKLRGDTGEALRATGDIRIDEGTFRAYGQRLEIERGLISYTNSPIDNPGINVRATRQIGDVVVGVNALGTARRTTVSTFSSPAMSENDRISYLVAGKPAREGASVSLEREIAKDLTVGVNVDTKTGESSFVTRYRILRTLYVEVGSSVRSSSLDLFYSIETE